jgi:hypothetical protein
MAENTPSTLKIVDVAEKARFSFGINSRYRHDNNSYSTLTTFGKIFAIVQRIIHPANPWMRFSFGERSGKTGLLIPGLGVGYIEENSQNVAVEFNLTGVNLIISIPRRSAKNTAHYDFPTRRICRRSHNNRSFQFRRGHPGLRRWNGNGCSGYIPQPRSAGDEHMFPAAGFADFPKVSVIRPALINVS